MKIKKRILFLALTGAMTLGLMQGMSMTALAEGDTSTYTLTIPSTLTVANSGWNATDGISATGTLASGKKLSVTASSANSWALVSGSNSVGYTLATASADTTATTSWAFTELSSTAITKPMGIIVEDYSSKPAGTYQDTVTFTASVDNAPTLNVETMSFTSWGVSSLTTTSSHNVFQYYTSTKDNDAVINKNATNKFTAMGSYKIYKIVISGTTYQVYGTGWSGNTYTSSDGATEIAVNTNSYISGDSSNPLVFTVYYE
ncbi:hypothetical protein [Butyrivibrio sp. WCD2001]|uniref:hypothetical protein n=1 Tax=Butyrivibrio sp. WCD2001 TaxID=1280681 RepID=UPI0004216BDF|nr:hypothetical protein [Butyrivibrio sp. WCD2001]